MDPLPPLNPLKAFEATGRWLSVSKAAEELCVTPAAVSRQIKALEDFLGVQVFKRVPGGLEFTPAGSRYLADVAPLLQSLREATNVVMGGGYRRHVLKIRSPATFAVRWLIPRLASFHRSHPEIDVRLTTSPAPLNFEREDIDAGCELGDGQWPHLRLLRLVPNVLAAVMAPGMAARVAAAQPMRPEQLAGETLLHSLARPDDWALWLKASGVEGVNAYRGMKYETSLLAYQAAIEGHGVAMAHKALVESELAQGRLVSPLAFELDRGPYTYYFASPADKPASVALQAFERWLRELVADSPPAAVGIAAGTPTPPAQPGVDKR